MKERFTSDNPLANSTFMRSLACMTVVLLLLTFTPEKSFLVHGELFGDELVYKVSRYLSSDQNPDLLLLGSSLLIGPAIDCDQTLPNTPAPPKGSQCHLYDKATFLEHLLQKRTATKHSIYNLALPGAMMSDQSILLEEAIRCGKKPAVVILGLAPRDFIANDRPKPETTPVAKEVEKIRIERLKDLTPGCIRQKLDLAVTRQKESWDHKLYGTRAIITTSLFDMIPWAHRKTGNRKARQLAHAKSQPENCTARFNRPGRATERQIEYYRTIYTPYQSSIFDKQCPYLRKALQTAKDNSVAAVIVNMPLSAPIKSLLEADATKRYNDTLSQLAREFSVAYLDLGTSDDQFGFDDFGDAVHLNAAGGKKFFDSLSSLLAEDPSLTAKLKLCSSSSSN